MKGLQPCGQTCRQHTSNSHSCLTWSREKGHRTQLVVEINRRDVKKIKLGIKGFVAIRRLLASYSRKTTRGSIRPPSCKCKVCSSKQVDDQINTKLFPSSLERLRNLRTIHSGQFCTMLQNIRVMRIVRSILVGTTRYHYYHQVPLPS